MKEPSRVPTLLAVDLGLRCGLACFALSLDDARVRGARGGVAEVEQVGAGVAGVAGVAGATLPARLRWYRSTHFGSVRQMKAAIRGILWEADRPRRIVLEGDRDLALPWQRAGARLGAEVVLVSAERWRPEMLLAREQRAGRDAKKAADTRARALIASSALPAPTSLRHDAAEAICLGAWACGLR